MPCLTEQCRSVSVSVDLSKKKERELFADVMLMSPLFFTFTFSGFILCCPRSELLTGTSFHRRFQFTRYTY